MSQSASDGLRSPFRFPKDYAPPIPMYHSSGGFLDLYPQYMPDNTLFVPNIGWHTPQPDTLQNAFPTHGMGTIEAEDPRFKGIGIRQPDSPQLSIPTLDFGTPESIRDEIPYFPDDSPQQPSSSGTFSSMRTGRVQDDVVWTAPSYDPTIPLTNGEKKVAVKKLVAAIHNNANCKEKSSSKTFLNRWSSTANYYAAEEIEMLAGEVVETMTGIHKVGWTKKLYDPTLRKQIAQTMHYTFEERLEKVVELLTYSKRTCEDLLKGEKLHSVIGAPHVLQSRTISNCKSNERKAARIRRATALEKAEQAEALARNETVPDKKVRNRKGRKRVHSDDEYEAAPGTPSHRPVKKTRMNGSMKVRSIKGRNA